MSALRVVPVTREAADGFVRMWHRHLDPPLPAVFRLAVATDDGVLRGVALVGWPKARAYADGSTLEVNRTATDGTPNANSALYGACWRAARALGYRRLITYTQAGESGASLRGAGWRVIAERPARRGWDTRRGPARTAASTASPAPCGRQCEHRGPPGHHRRNPRPGGRRALRLRQRLARPGRRQAGPVYPLSPAPRRHASGASGVERPVTGDGDDLVGWLGETYGLDVYEAAWELHAAPIPPAAPTPVDLDSLPAREAAP